jgi:distribution and morphology protein 31
MMKKTGQFLSLTTGTTISFESATPNWKDGTIRFYKVHVSCIPRSEQVKFQQGIQEKNPVIVPGDLFSGIELDQDEMKNALV